MLILDINRKAYLGSPITQLHLTLSDLERPNSSSIIFRRPISRKGAELGHALLLNTNREGYMMSLLM